MKELVKNMTKNKKSEEHKKLGRPTKIHEEELRKLETAFKMGCNNSEACAYAEIPESTFYDYIKANQDFSDNINKWKKNPILKAKHTIYKSLEDPKTARWYLERKCKDEFSTAQEIFNTNANLEITNEKVIEKVMNKLKEL